ncbi:MAG TPA: hypothetical protein V6D31_03245 [Candidatus Sericytochromatia bacterium]
MKSKISNNSVAKLVKKRHGAKSVGYKDAIANPAFIYISPATLSQMTF